MRLNLAVLIVALSASAKEEDISAILKRFVTSQTANDAEARGYTCVEDADFFTYQNGGTELRKDRSEESDIIFVEGLRYKKLVTRNGQPLSPREQAETEKRLQETADYRRKHHPPAPGGTISFGKDRADLGSNEEILSLFDSRLEGVEEIRGRKAWVVESIPKAVQPDSEHIREVLKFRKKLWIDQQDHTLLKVVHTVVEPGVFAKPGTSVALEYQKLSDGPLVPESIVVDIYREVEKNSRPSGRTEYRYTRYRKFDVQSTITTD